MTNAKKIKINKSPFIWITGVILIIQCLSILVLLFWGVLTALKTQSDFRVNIFGLPKGMPWEWAWGNFPFVMKYFYVNVPVDGLIRKVFIPEQLLNTLIYALGGALAEAFVPCIVAYATTRFNFKFNKVLEGIVLVAMVLPIVGNTHASLMMFKTLGLYDTVFFNFFAKFNFLGIYFLIFKGTFARTSNAYAEAASIDGASEFTILLRIGIPLVIKLIMTIILIQFIFHWNDYQTPLLYMPSHPTLALGVFELSTSRIKDINTVPMRMAGCLLLAAPIIILFVAFREKLIGNLSMGGVKE